MPLRQHLLIVDDQRVDRAIGTHAATQIGYRVSCAASIEETRALLETGNHFDFVVLDLALGAEDGLEVLPLIARFDPTAVVVLASSFDGRILAASQRLASGLGLRVGGGRVAQADPADCAATIAPTVTPRHGPRRRGRGLIPPEQLRHAIDMGQITAWFQPQISLETGVVVGAEALARWCVPDGRWIPPGTFVRIAEQGGMAAALTDLMLDRALLACAGWRDKRPDCCVAVNVSPLLLDDPGIADRIEQKLRKHCVPPGALIVEITETNGIPDTPCAMEILTRLRIRGVNLAVDDFGTGHSSLLSLGRPVRRLTK